MIKRLISEQKTFAKNNKYEIVAISFNIISKLLDVIGTFAVQFWYKEDKIGKYQIHYKILGTTSGFCKSLDAHWIKNNLATQIGAGSECS